MALYVCSNLIVAASCLVVGLSHRPLVIDSRLSLCIFVLNIKFYLHYLYIVNTHCTIPIILLSSRSNRHFLHQLAPYKVTLQKLLQSLMHMNLLEKGSHCKRLPMSLCSPRWLVESLVLELWPSCTWFSCLPVWHIELMWNHVEFVSPDCKSPPMMFFYISLQPPQKYKGKLTHPVCAMDIIKRPMHWRGLAAWLVVRWTWHLMPTCELLLHLTIFVVTALLQIKHFDFVFLINVMG